MEEISLKTLENRINELIQTCDRLQDENHSLRQRQANLVSERAALVEQNEQARIKVEGILQRLRSMERD